MMNSKFIKRNLTRSPLKSSGEQIHHSPIFIIIDCTKSIEIDVTYGYLEQVQQSKLEEMKSTCQMFSSKLNIFKHAVVNYEKISVTYICDFFSRERVNLIWSDSQCLKTNGKWFSSMYKGSISIIDFYLLKVMQLFGS